MNSELLRNLETASVAYDDLAVGDRFVSAGPVHRMDAALSTRAKRLLLASRRSQRGQARHCREAGRR